MTPQDNVKLALLSAKLAKSALDLLGVQSVDLAKLMFKQIIVDLKELDGHMKTL